MKRKFPGRAALPLLAVCMGLGACGKTTTTSTPAPPTAYAALRLSATNGAPDTGFAGGRGIVTTKIDPALFDFALTVAIEPAPSNKILVGGSSGLSGQAVIALVRYNTDGTLDTTGFGTAGTGGIVRTPTPSGWTSASASAMTVQADGKILVAALTFNASANTTGIALLRYNSNGTPDLGFNGTGIVTATIGPGLATDTCALALQGDGKIVVAGASRSGDVVLYRYDTTGQPDTLNFGTGGTSVKNIGILARPPAIALQSSGKIIVATGTDIDEVVMRFGTDGVLDTTFGTGGTGIVKTGVGGGVNYANAVAVQSTPANPPTDDKIVVAGHANLTDATSDISLVRYTKDGALDTTFLGPLNNPNPGIVITDLAGQFDNGFSIALQAQPADESKIVVSGNTGLNGFSQIAVLRYKPDGTLDGSFGLNGVVIVQLVGPGNAASGNAVALQPVGGAIVVAGYD